MRRWLLTLSLIVAVLALVVAQGCASPCDSDAPGIKATLFGAAASSPDPSATPVADDDAGKLDPDEVPFGQRILNSLKGH